MLKLGVVSFIYDSPISNENIIYNDFICENFIKKKDFFLTNKYSWYNYTSPKSKIEIFYIKDINENNYYKNRRVILHLLTFKTPT